MTTDRPAYLAFEGHDLVAEGDLARVAAELADRPSPPPGTSVVVIAPASGRAVDLDLRGGPEAVAARYAPAPDDRTTDDPASDEAEASPEGTDPAPRRRGRPRLGVVGREVTLLPRHWAWLETQRGGASATLRRLVDEARRASADADARRASQDVTLRFISTLAGDLPGFEEASRALYAEDAERFRSETDAWPTDVRRVALRLAEPALAPPAAPT